jgi:hypothetical protein
MEKPRPAATACAIDGAACSTSPSVGWSATARGRDASAISLLRFALSA